MWACQWLVLNYDVFPTACTLLTIKVYRLSFIVYRLFVTSLDTTLCYSDKTQATCNIHDLNESSHVGRNHK